MTMRRHGITIALALIFSVGLVGAAGSGENRAYKAASAAFNDAVWWRAETEFAQFVAKYPKSELVPEAVLLQAQAQFKQGKFAPAIALLTARESKAANLADQYLYWIAEAQFQSGAYVAAADAFGRLTREFAGSARRLEASVGEAAARAKLGEWSRVVELLQAPNSAFQSVAQSRPEDDAVVRGRLLLVEAALAQRNFATAEAALQPLETQKLSAELDWQRNYSLCRVQLGAGKTNDALQCCTNLLTLAEAAARRDFLAESVALQAGILEQLGRLEEASAAFRRNLAADVPAERQREALLKVTELTVAQDRLSEAGETLEKFLGQFPNAPAADLALLTLGELHLKRHFILLETNNVPPGTNHLQQAIVYFDRLVNTISNSSLVGKAQLDRGWCFWTDGKIPESLEAFKAAVMRLAPSEDLVVARFKLADALFAQKKFPDALENYRAVVDTLAAWPRVKAALGDQALYQMLRTSLELKDVAGASRAMEQILHSDPPSPTADRSVLLVGQGFADLDEGDKARAEFARFVATFPESPLRPEVELALARTREQKGEWKEAVADYDGWLERFATNSLRPRAEFNRALANYHAGNETNALTLFTNFVVQFPTNDLAPQAQWWVADYHYRQGDFHFLDAEKNYKLIFQNWPSSELAFEARMMAGRAAFSRRDYAGAIDHFTNLTSNPNCPPGLKLQATFAYGSALMILDSGETRRPANLELAVQVFGTIQNSNPTNESGALASGEIGKCYFQLAAQDPRYYEPASNAFRQVIRSQYAGVAARSQAQIGLGLVLEEMAARKSGDEQIGLLKLALGNYLDVFHAENLREAETSDLFWVKEAGLKAVRVTEALGQWEAMEKLCRRLAALLPQLQASLDKKIARAQQHLGAEKTEPGFDSSATGRKLPVDSQ